MHELDDDAMDVDEGGLSNQTSAAKALSIMRLLAHANNGTLGLTELAKALDLPKSTAHRLLRVLILEGFAEQSDRRYRLGSEFFEISHFARWSSYGDIRETAAPILENLCESVRETVHLAVLAGPDVLYLEKISAPGGSRVPSRVGGRMPATCTSLGKALIAFRSAEERDITLRGPLPRITPYSITNPQVLHEQFELARVRGVAFEYEESRLGVSCVAAPICVDGRAFAAISVAGPTSRFNPVSASGALKAAAAKLRTSLSYIVTT
jgi:DNA-binding IclR family transcriptional regulator